jgi:hypothetical protein
MGSEQQLVANKQMVAKCNTKGNKWQVSGGPKTYFTLLSNGFVGGSISEIFLAHFSYALVDFSSPGIERNGKCFQKQIFQWTGSVDN